MVFTRPGRHKSHCMARGLATLVYSMVMSFPSTLLTIAVQRTELYSEGSLHITWHPMPGVKSTFRSFMSFLRRRVADDKQNDQNTEGSTLLVRQVRACVMSVQASWLG